MAKVIIFDNKRIIEPGVYAETKAGESQLPDTVSSGNVMIIDTGSGASYGFGCGINGEKTQGMNSVYAFDRLDDAQNAIRGGLLWDVIKYLFKPSRDPAIRGCQRLFLVRAAETTKAIYSYSPVGGGGNGGTIIFATKTEGNGANGLLNSLPDLNTGFALKVILGTNDPTKLVVQLWQGTFKGYDVNGAPFDEIAEIETKPVLLAQSPELNNIDDIASWVLNDSAANSYLYVVSNTPVGTGAIDVNDVIVGYGLFTGGTESYGVGDYTKVLNTIGEVDNTFFLSDNTQGDATDTQNFKLLAHIVTQAEFKKFIYIGGSNNVLADTRTYAEAFNSARVHMIHSSIEHPGINNNKVIKTLDSIYNAAMMCGRAAGLAPQTPTIWLDTDVTGIGDELTQPDREDAIQSGVMTLKNVDGLGIVINSDINTLQNNTIDILPDGTSPDGSTMRIATFLNKFLVKQLRVKFIPGKNAATASPTDVKAAVEGILKAQSATKTDDGLILSYRNINVLLQGGDYKISYGFVPNGPIKRMFITGFMFNVSLSA